MAWKMGSKVPDIFPLFYSLFYRGEWKARNEERTGFDVVEQRRGIREGAWPNHLKPLKDAKCSVASGHDAKNWTRPRLAYRRSGHALAGWPGGELPGGLPISSLTVCTVPLACCCCVCCLAFDCYFLTAVVPFLVVYLALLLSPLYLVSTPSCSCLWYFEDFDLAVQH